MTPPSNGWETGKPQGNGLEVMDGTVRAQLRATGGRRPRARVYVQTQEGWAGMDIDPAATPPLILATGVGRRKEDARDALEAPQRAR